jgi:hypothetical protein
MESLQFGDNIVKGDRITYREREYKYQLLIPYAVYIPILGYSIEEKYFSLNEAGHLYIHPLYAWDGPSGPTFDTPSFMRGSLVHDVLYQMIRLELLPVEMKEIADDILYDICIEDGMWRVRALWVKRAVKRFGASSCVPGSDVREIKTAP